MYISICLLNNRFLVKTKFTHRPDIKSDQTPWCDGGTDALLPSLL